MVEFIDKTTERAGTPINREALMAIQGFESVTMVCNPDDGSITKTNGLGQTLTIKYNTNGTTTETFVGDKTITKTISFSDGKVVFKIS